ncbi:MAG: transposase [Microgenomates group bacterium]
MPSRKVPLVNGEYYHVFNRSVFQHPIFSNEREAKAFVKALTYYTLINPPRSLSLEKRYKENIMDYNERLVSILAYCVMPNHFHIELKQEVDGGISTYLRRLSLSFVRYYNLLHKQKGSLFESLFNSVLIESENQLLHVSRYIHLNPTSAMLVNDPIQYPYSSFRMYVYGGEKPPFVFDDILRGNKRGNYERFVNDNVGYQQTLQFIKNQLIDHEI